MTLEIHYIQTALKKFCKTLLLTKSPIEAVARQDALTLCSLWESDDRSQPMFSCIQKGKNWMQPVLENYFARKVYKSVDNNFVHCSVCAHQHYANI